MAGFHVRCQACNLVLSETKMSKIVAHARSAKHGKKALQASENNQLKQEIAGILERFTIKAFETTTLRLA